MISQNPQNILLIQLGDIGDVILTIPCIRALKETFPAAYIYVAVRDKASGIIELCEWSSGVIPITNKKRGLVAEIGHQIRFFSKLRSLRFDLAIDMRTGTRGAIIAFLSGAGKRLAFFAPDGKLWRNRVFTNLVVPKYIIDQHMVDYNLGLLAPFKIIPKERKPQIRIPLESQRAIKDLFLKEGISGDLPLVAIQPFSLWQYKEWPQEKFVALINWIKEKYNLPILITGGPDERQRAADLATKAGKEVYNMAGKTSIEMYAALLSLCRLMISVDSAGPHLAAAVGTPTVTIYGPSSPDVWAPIGRQHLVVQKKLACVPCSLTGCEGSMVSRCIVDLDVDEVKLAVEKQLENL